MTSRRVTKSVTSRFVSRHVTPGPARRLEACRHALPWPERDTREQLDYRTQRAWAHKGPLCSKGTRPGPGAQLASDQLTPRARQNSNCGAQSPVLLDMREARRDGLLQLNQARPAVARRHKTPVVWLRTMEVVAATSAQPAQRSAAPRPGLGQAAWRRQSGRRPGEGPRTRPQR